MIHSFIHFSYVIYLESLISGRIDRVVRRRLRPIAVRARFIERSDFVPEIGYQGDVSSEQAWEMLAQDADAVLIDVRTPAEWAFVGVPDLAILDRQPHFVSWQHYPSMDKNIDFVGGIEALGIERTQTLLFLCRSGARSRAAATEVTAHGFVRAFNISDGFEGGLDEKGHRGRQEGWKASGLPWAQQ